MDKRNDLDWIGMLAFVYDNEHHLGLQSCVARECDRRGFFHYYYLPPSVLWWVRKATVGGGRFLFFWEIDGEPCGKNKCEQNEVR